MKSLVTYAMAKDINIKEKYQGKPQDDSHLDAKSANLNLKY